MTIFYFTSTGNSLYVAKKIGNNDSELISIPQIINHSTLEYTDDVIGVVFPIYGFGLPKMVHKFLEKVKLNAEYTFAIGTYGNLSGAAMLSANKFATKRGRGFDYVESLLMFDNYLPLFEVAHEIERTKGKHTEENLSKIISNINARKKQSPKVSIVWKIISAIIKGGEKFVMSNKQAQNYIIDEKCVKCEICAKICPAHNITVT
ncbi:MAG: EFR1 family ferrodoxin, partial [Bacteroidales bacterium]|nr:EFR1 family ferrodoxin [Bacteroidales bacterium]